MRGARALISIRQAVGWASEEKSDIVGPSGLHKDDNPPVPCQKRVITEPRSPGESLAEISSIRSPAGHPFAQQYRSGRPSRVIEIHPPRTIMVPLSLQPLAVLLSRWKRD